MKSRLLISLVAFASFSSLSSYAECLKSGYLPQVYEVVGSDGDVRIQFKPEKDRTDLAIMAGIGMGALGGVSAGGGETGTIVGGLIGAIPGVYYGFSEYAERKQEYRKFILWSLIAQNAPTVETPETRVLIREIKANQQEIESLVQEQVQTLGIQLLTPITIQDIALAAQKLNENQTACTTKKDGRKKIVSAKRLAALIVDEVLGRTR